MNLLCLYCLWASVIWLAHASLDAIMTVSMDNFEYASFYGAISDDYAQRVCQQRFQGNLVDDPILSIKLYGLCHEMDQPESECFICQRAINCCHAFEAIHQWSKPCSKGMDHDSCLDINRACTWTQCGYRGSCQYRDGNEEGRSKNRQKKNRKYFWTKKRKNKEKKRTNCHEFDSQLACHYGDRDLSCVWREEPPIKSDDKSIENELSGLGRTFAVETNELSGGTLTGLDRLIEKQLHKKFPKWKKFERLQAYPGFKKKKKRKKRKKERQRKQKGTKESVMEIVREMDENEKREILNELNAMEMESEEIIGDTRIFLDDENARKLTSNGIELLSGSAGGGEAVGMVLAGFLILSAIVVAIVRQFGAYKLHLFVETSNLNSYGIEMGHGNDPLMGTPSPTLGPCNEDYEEIKDAPISDNLIIRNNHFQPSGTTSIDSGTAMNGGTGGMVSNGVAIKSISSETIQSNQDTLIHQTVHLHSHQSPRTNSHGSNLIQPNSDELKVKRVSFLSGYRDALTERDGLMNGLTEDDSLLTVPGNVSSTSSHGGNGNPNGNASAAAGKVYGATNDMNRRVTFLID